METLCKIRDIYRAVIAVESQMEKIHNLSLNEGMLLCSLLKTERLSSGEIADVLGVATSNASKLIKSVENKELIERVLGNVDKRQMYFSLTEKGRLILSKIKCEKLEIPELLQAILETDVF